MEELTRYNIVAYRGLWDKLARPDSVDAIIRSQLKNIPTLIHISSETEFIATLDQMMMNQVYEKKESPPLFFFSENPLEITIPDNFAFFLTHTSIYSIIPSDTEGIYSIHRINECLDPKKNIGLYLNTKFLNNNLTNLSPQLKIYKPDVLLYESSNTLTQITTTPHFQSSTDDKIQFKLQQHFSEHTQIIKVSDLIELESLKNQPSITIPPLDLKTSTSLEDLPFDELNSFIDTIDCLLSNIEIPCFTHALSRKVNLTNYSLRFIHPEENNFYRLVPEFGFETQPIVISAGLRNSKFAAIFFWEIMHILQDNGLWIDIDNLSLCEGTDLCAADYFERDYFLQHLTKLRMEQRDTHLFSVYQKTATTNTLQCFDNKKWSFGILTAGQSANAVKMVETICSSKDVDFEIILCGPEQKSLPNDDRIKYIHFPPEPRGWITRKKNFIVNEAQNPNLCIMHDRFDFPDNFFQAMERYGNVFSFLTFPQPYMPCNTNPVAIRYADYQVLQPAVLSEVILESKIVNQNNIYHPHYDDFYETAFCCGGVYVCKKSLWQQIKQDESLFHAECEDIVFGLESQRAGIPHRVNPFVSFESKGAHPLLLKDIKTIHDSGELYRHSAQVTPPQKEMARLFPEEFKPVLNNTKDDYVLKIISNYNNITGVSNSKKLTMNDFEGVLSLSQVWEIVHDRIKQIKISHRDDLLSLYSFLSISVFNWPNCTILSWIKNSETILRSSLQDTFKTINTTVGWGIGGLFESTFSKLNLSLDYLVDNNSSSWGKTFSGLEVMPPDHLRRESPETTAIIIFSSFVDEIKKQVSSFGKFQTLVVYDLLEKDDYPPFTQIIQYFREVEKLYPVIFKPESINLSTSRSADMSKDNIRLKSDLYSNYLNLSSEINLNNITYKNNVYPPIRKYF